MQTIAIIVAAGRGIRFGGPTPKQYLDLAGEPVLTHTLRAVLAAPVDAVLVAIHPDARADYERAVASLDDKRLLPAVMGGRSRAESVRNALEALQEQAPARVLIHDGARPFITPERIRALIEAEGAAILAEPLVDALWREDDGKADAPIARDGLWRAQTPQCFPYRELLEAHRAEAASGNQPALDDAETYRRAGGQVTLIKGNAENFKITTSDDLARAERLLLPAFETRTGQGFDVHRFAPGDHVWLCGLRIPHDQRLEGHSDADIGLHALSDAIYGALADGDIGRHFPPSDPQWKDAESHIFLSHAAGLVHARGGRIVHAEVTLMAEAPKIAPHADAMRTRLGEIMKVSASRIGVKATTMERMGFVGRGEGLAALASATIELPRERSREHP